MATDIYGPPAPPAAPTNAPTVAGAFTGGQSNAGYFIQGPDYSLSLMLDGATALTGLPRATFNPNIAGFGVFDGYALPQTWKTLTAGEDTAYGQGGDAGTTYGGVGLYVVGDGTGNFLADNGGDPSTWSEGEIGRNVRRFTLLLTTAEKAAVPAIFWLHTENDSQHQGSDATAKARYKGAVLRWMQLLRSWLGRSAASLPFFVGFPMPYGFAQANTQRMIRSVFSELALDAANNFHVLVRQTADVDPRGGTDTSHVDTDDIRMWGRRGAYALARWWRGLTGSAAPTGCPGTGPFIIHAHAQTGTTTVVTVQHDQGTELRLGVRSDGSGAADGRGWSIDDGGTSRAVTACAIVSATQVRLTHAACTAAATSRGVGYCLYGERLYRGGGIYDNYSTKAALSGLAADWRIDWPVAGTLAPMMASATAFDGTVVTPPPEDPPPTEPTPASATLTVGTGSDTLVLKLTQEAYQGSCQYTVSIDGTQIGNTLTAVALRGSGQMDTVTVLANLAVGSHTVTVNFLNDLYGGSPTTDRNLYVESATFNGAAVTGGALALLSTGPGSFTVSKSGTVTPPPNTSPPTSTPANKLLVPRLGRLMISRGGKPLLGGESNSAPTIITAPSGQLFDMATARKGVPAVNDQFEYITHSRDWQATLNHATEGFCGVRWQPTWVKAEGFFGAWEPAQGHIFRAYRKGASGQDAQTLVLVSGPNPSAIPAGDPVVLFTAATEGNTDKVSSLNLNGFNVPLRQKLTCLRSTGSAVFDDVGQRIVEIDMGTPLPAIDYTPPAQPNTWYSSSTFQLRHWEFYADPATKRLRHPLGWFRDITIDSILANGGYVMLGGNQFIPTWDDWTNQYQQIGASLVEELWRKEQQGLAETFGNTDPKRLAVELENEPTREWGTTAAGPGLGDLMPDVWYGIARQTWGPSRTLVVKSNQFGSLDGLDVFNFTCPTGDNALLACHNYGSGQIHWPNGAMNWGDSAQTDWMAQKLAAKIQALGYKGGGYTELGVGTSEFWDYNLKVSDDERGRRLGRCLTSLTNNNLFMFSWGYVGDDNYSVEVRDIGGKQVEAYLPGISPYARRAGITTT